MSDRVTELLLKAVRQLPQDEQDEVLAGLLSGRLDAPVAPAPAAVAVVAPDGRPGGRPPGATRMLRSRVISGGWIRPLDRTASGTLFGSPSGTPADTDLRVLPVRLPTSDYDRLRAFSREHGFSMAVIIRTLVERFLEAQERH